MICVPLCPSAGIFDAFDVFQPDLARCLSQKFCILMSFLKADKQGEEKDCNSFPAIAITVFLGHLRLQIREKHYWGYFN